MKKRMMAICLMVVMIAGMLPTNLIAEAETTSEPMHIAAYLEAPVNVDGNLTETGWLTYGQLSGSGTTREFGALWDSENIYLALVPQEQSERCSVVIAGKTLIIAADGMVEGDLKDTAVVGRNGAVEIKIPFQAIGKTLSSYAQNVDLALSVGGAEYKGQLRFGSRVREVSKLSVDSFGLKSPKTAQTMWGPTKGGFRMCDKYIEGGTNVAGGRAYMIKANNGTLLNRTETVGFEFDFHAASMPVYEAKYIGTAWCNYGFTFVISDSTCAGLTLSIVNTADGLTLCVLGSNNGSPAFYTVKLNRQVGERFHICLDWMLDGALRVLVDDKTAGIVENAERNGTTMKANGWSSAGVLNLNLLRNATAPTSPDEDIDFTITNMALSKEYGNQVLDQLTYGDILGSNGSKDAVSSDLILPAIWSGSQIKNIALTWESSDPDVISSQGKVTVSDKEKEVTLTASLQDDPNQTKQFVVTVTKIKADSFVTTESMSMDGIMKEASWKLAGAFAVSIGEGAPTGRLYTTWGQGKAYFAIPFSNADTLELMLGDKMLTLDLVSGVFGGESYGAQAAVKDCVAEVCVTLKNLGIQLLDYNQSIDFNARLTRDNTSSSLEKGSISLVFTGKNVNLYSIKDELTCAALLPGVNLSDVRNDLTLPGTYVSDYLGEVPLTWTSSDKGILNVETGKVTRPGEKVGAYVDLTLMVGSQEIWTEEIYVAPMKESIIQSPVILNVPFTGSEVAVDGKTLDEGWNLNTLVVNEGIVTGRFGAQWNLSHLYVAVDTGGEKLVLTLNDKLIDLTKIRAMTDGDMIELEIPLENLDVNVTDYGEEISVKVELGEAVYEGTLVLTSTDWFTTGGCMPQTPMKLGGTGALGSDAKTEGQGYVKTGEGWYLYDHYSSTGNNPTKIRTYLIFWGNGGTEEEQALFAHLNDRTRATYAEFDFKAASMPVYSVSSATGWDTGFASYGFTWWLSDKADAAKNSNSVSFGIVNTEEGLVFVAQGSRELTNVKLNKHVGDQFRIGTRWETDGSVTLYVDGVKIAVIENVEKRRTGFGDNSFAMNLIRSGDRAASKNDNFDIYISNLALGKAYGDCVMDSLTFDVIRGENEDPYEITSALDLPDKWSDSQLVKAVDITWTSSNPSVIGVDGTVVQPAANGKLVTLTAELAGRKKVFELYVKGQSVSEDVLIVPNDRDTANGAGIGVDLYQFTLDENNNSIVRDLYTRKKVNVIALRDGDEVNRLNESVLTIWISDDNVTYTQVKPFKLLRAGRMTYLYDFEATGRYIKVHCTHYHGAEADFTGSLDGMMDVYYEDVFGANGSEFTEKSSIALTNKESYTRYDDIWTVSAREAGVKAAAMDMADVRFYYGEELLYHYYDGTDFRVRVPKVESGASITVNVLSGNRDAMDISNKEYVHEVVYGTRETIVSDGVGRWLVALPNRTLMSIYTIRDEDAGDLESGDDIEYLAYSLSYNNGMTWSEPVKIKISKGWINAPGGVVYDAHKGRIIIQGYEYVGFVSGDVSQSNCKTRFICSDDMGKTWYRLGEMQMEGTAATYVLSYSDPLELSTYDGDGPNIDFVLNCGVQYDNRGTFTCRVAYSADGGLTWTLGADEILYSEGEGIGAMEGGVSEATILEREDGTLVLYARCQYDSVNTFARAISTDHGLTWTKAAELSGVYTPNTQPIMYEFGKSPLMFWGGNNALGGNSYQRMPMSVGISRDGLMTFENIQDLYSRYSLQGMTAATRNQITNQSVASIDDTLILAWGNNFKEILLMRVDDFTDYFFRTRGAYDGFENSTVKYEGWSVTGGTVSVSDERSTEGKRSMKLLPDSAAVRSIPYLQDGTIAFDLYLDRADANFTVELEAAYSDVYGKAAPIALRVENGVLFFGDEGEAGQSAVTLRQGWNSFVFTLQLSAAAPTAALAVNGADPIVVPVDGEIGDYICWVDITTGMTTCYLDGFLVMNRMPVEVPDKPADAPDSDDQKEPVNPDTPGDSKDQTDGKNPGDPQIPTDIVKESPKTGDSDIAVFFAGWMAFLCSFAVLLIYRRRMAGQGAGEHNRK